MRIYIHMIEILIQQPVYLILIAAIVTVLTGILKSVFSFIKMAELTYFIPYLLGEAGMFIYCLIAKIDVKSNISQILLNGVYAAFLSSVIYQLYKQVKDMGLKAVLGGGTAVKIYLELKSKMDSGLNAMTYARRLKDVDSDDIATMVEILRGSGIEELNLYGVANSVSAIIKACTDKKKQASEKQTVKEEQADDQRN